MRPWAWICLPYRSALSFASQAQSGLRAGFRAGQQNNGRHLQLLGKRYRMVRHGEHTYEVVVDWNGNRGTGTSDYRSYGREHTISAGGKPPIPGSSDQAFRG